MLLIKITENLLVNFDWTAFDVTNSPEVQWESMIQYIRNTLSITCQFKKVNSCKTVTPWLTPEIHKLIREKILLINKYKITKINSTTLTEMRLKRNKLNSRIDRAKAMYSENTLNQAVKRTKRFWKIIKSLIDQVDCVDITVYTFKHIDTGTKVPKADIPDFVIEYFVNISRRTCGQFNYHDLIIYREFYSNVNSNFDIIPPLVEEMYGYMGIWKPGYE